MKKPKWYEQIPKCGVLCKTPCGVPVFVEQRIDNDIYLDIHGNRYSNMTPLTKEEVMKYIYMDKNEKIN